MIRYSNINWGMCNSRDFINIKKLTEKIGGEHIILITAPSRLEDVMTFKTTNNITIPVYQISDGRFPLPLEKENLPFLFIMDKQFLTKFVFIPDPATPSLLEHYVELVKDRFISRTISP